MTGETTDEMTDQMNGKIRQTMQHFFTPEGRQALARLLQQKPLLAFDFDGTLAPIVTRPEQARISRGVVARLSLLASQLPVAIITGRAVQDVRSRLGFEPRYIVGNHGAEDLANPVWVGALMHALAPVRARLEAAAADLAGAGVVVEDKGQSIALHYRLARQPQAALDCISEFLLQLDDQFHVFPGKMVVNIVPAGAPNKADAMLALVDRSQAGQAFFAGDDVNDEPVFAAAPATWLTVRIGRDDPASRAMFYIDSAAEMALLLEQMIEQIHLRG